ncbi:hypothetical protein LENED_003792 [Lentinula edodes]|uniref:Uncharacterized protein n=1 Tax=Lentinula edodes TaxID=5353 RepID=A0A1Q3E4R3_LENED|nr:hypothetical protein LENED_003792 [Lentinula edodes]
MGIISSTSAHSPNDATVIETQITDDELPGISITNLLVSQRAHSPLTPKHLPIKATGFTSTSINRGDIRTYLTPRDKPNVGTSYDSASPILSPTSPSRITVANTKNRKLLPLPNKPSNTFGGHPGKQPRTQLPTYGETTDSQSSSWKLHNGSTSSKGSSAKQPRRLPRMVHGAPRDVQKRLGRRPRKFPIHATAAALINQSKERFSKKPVTVSTSETDNNQEILSTEPEGFAIPSRSIQRSPKLFDVEKQGPRIPDTSASPHNVMRNSQYKSEEEHDLVGALTSAFTRNAIPDDFDNSSDFSSGTHSDVAPPKRSRSLRQAIKRVPQIPTSPALNLLRQERTPGGLCVPLSEEAIQKYLDVEYSSVHLPLGVSVAPENDSEYVDPNDELLLDYDSSNEIVAMRREQQQLRLYHAPTVLVHNLRFVMEQAESSAGGISRSNPFRQYNVSTMPLTMAYVHRVESHCGYGALDSIRSSMPDWDFHPKPLKYRIRVAADGSYSNNAVPAESLDVGELVARPEKHPQPENDSETRKRVKFFNNVANLVPSTTLSEGAGRPEFDVIACGELLLKLVKGKVQIAAQELEDIMSFLRNPSLEYMAKKFRQGDDLGFFNTVARHDYDSIWRSLRYIMQSASGALGIPEPIEGALKWEASRVMKNI